MKTRLATKADAEAWLAMRMALWPDANEDELRLEVARYFVAHGEPLLPHRVFVADDRWQDRRHAGAVAAALCGWLRQLAGAVHRGVVRRAGRAARAASAARSCGRRSSGRCENGYTEMASDALLENTISERAHAALGFEEVERAIRFRKTLKR